MKRVNLLLLILSGVAAISFAQTVNNDSLRQEGIASWYGQEFAGRPTACGEIFNPALFTAAHPSLPFGTILTVTNKQNMRQVTVRINDRGPFVAARIIDLSRAAAEALDMVSTGTAPVILQRADNTALGPVSATAAEVAQVPVTPVAAPAEPVIHNGIYDQAQTQAENTVTAEAITTPAVPQAFYPAQAANILGGIPPMGSSKFYRLQVGAFKVPRNAVDAFNKLKNAGLNPAYEQSGDFYRVVLAGLKAGEIPSIAQTLGNTGFREAIIREEQ